MKESISLEAREFILLGKTGVNPYLATFQNGNEKVTKDELVEGLRATLIQYICRLSNAPYESLFALSALKSCHILMPTRYGGYQISFGIFMPTGLKQNRTCLIDLPVLSCLYSIRKLLNPRDTDDGILTEVLFLREFYSQIYVVGSFGTVDAHIALLLGEQPVDNQSLDSILSQVNHLHYTPSAMSWSQIFTFLRSEA